MKFNKLLILMISIFVSWDVNAFKQGIHGNITDSMLTINGFDEHSTDEASDSNYNTDYFEPHIAAAHADNNRLDSASIRLKNKRNEIADALEACDRRAALDSLGEALHTVQDIYSHSNSVDDGIGIPDLLNMSRGTAKCSPSNDIPGIEHFYSDGLVTGFFNLVLPIGILQCTDPLQGQDDCCHYYLNKDNSSQFNGGNFVPARNAAREATTNYLKLLYDYLNERFSPKDVGFYKKMLKNVQRKTVYVIDTTGSMEDNIEALKRDINSFLDEVTVDNSDNNAPSLDLVTFKDEDEIHSTGLVCNISDFRENINNLEAYGGDDCPEASGKALVTALEEFDVIGTPLIPIGGDIILYTDASPSDPSLVESVSSVARSRGVKVNSIIDGDCVETSKNIGQKLNYVFSNNKTNQLPHKSNNSKTVLNSPRYIYQALAEETGGVSFQVNKEEVDKVLPITKYITDVKTEIIYSNNITLKPDATFENLIKVDSSISNNSMLVLVKTMDLSNAPIVSIFRPDNTELTDTDPNVSITRLSTVIAYKINNPTIGDWRIKLLSGPTDYLFRVFAKSNFGISKLNILEEPETSIRHVDFIPIEGNPTAGDELLMQLHTTSRPQTINLELIRKGGTRISEYSLSEIIERPRLYESLITVPNEEFSIRLYGDLDSNSQFQREFPIQITPNNIKLKIQQQIPYGSSNVILNNNVISVFPNSEITFQILVKNVSSTATSYSIVLNSDSNYPTLFSDEITVDGESTGNVSVTVIIPKSVTINSSEGLFFKFQDSKNEKNSNYIVANLVVKSDELFVSGFE